MTTGNNPASARRTLVLTRVFDAPRTLVWKVWTDPQHIVLWWGTNEYNTAPLCEIDLRVGGKYLYCMRSPDGKESWTTGTFREIIPLEKLVYTDSFSDAQGNHVSPKTYGLDDFPEELLVTVTFEDVSDKTRLTVTHADFPANEIAEMTEAGWNETLDRFAAALK